MLTKKQEMYINRLTKWAEHLKNVDERHFDIATFVREGYLKDEITATSILKKTIKGKIFHNCSTAACAVGYLPCIFPNHFSYSKHNYEFHSELTRFFDIDIDAVNSIQYPSSYPNIKNVTPKIVSKRILREANRLKNKYEKENKMKEKKIGAK